MFNTYLSLNEPTKTNVVQFVIANFERVNLVLFLSNKNIFSLVNYEICSLIALLLIFMLSSPFILPCSYFSYGLMFFLHFFCSLLSVNIWVSFCHCEVYRCIFTTKWSIYGCLSVIVRYTDAFLQLNGQYMGVFLSL